MTIAVQDYKVKCFKCHVVIGRPNAPIRWFICGECNRLLGGK